MDAFSVIRLEGGEKQQQQRGSAASMSDWTEEFGRSRAVPPRGQTARQSDSGRTPQGFKLTLKKLDGVSVFQRALSVQLRGTLWDSLQHLFYGNTWRSREQSYSGEENTLDIQQEAVYFLSVCSASSVLVVELVELTSQHALGRGFGILQLDSASPGDQRVAMCKGTPRDLLTPGLKHTEVTGVELVCCLQHDASLRSVIPLLPPNMLISSHTHLPGTTHTPHTPHSADTGHGWRCVRSVKCVLRGVHLSLLPSLQEFEQQLLNTHTLNTQGVCSLSVCVQERRLHVGVHNGLKFTHTPQVILLDTSAPPSVLELQGAVELQLVHHPSFALVFQLEYVLSSSSSSSSILSPDTQLMSSGRPLLQCVCVGWGVWRPTAEEGEGLRRQEVVLQLGDGVSAKAPPPNPFGVMTYTPEQATDGAVQLSFSFSSRDGRSSRSHSPSPAKRRPPRSPARDELQVSPLKSAHNLTTQGPALSLSQLAASSTLRNVTLSPWQQQTHSTSGQQVSISGIVHLERCVKELHDDDEGEDLQELSFTHTHAPVIILPTQHTGVRRRSRRSVLSMLASCRFPEIRDVSGHLAPMLNPHDTPQPPLNPPRELADTLTHNTLILQFLAFTRTPQEGLGCDWVSCIHFSFQLYRFPPIVTPPMQLIGSHPPSSPNDIAPCILAPLNKDRTPNSEVPGLQLHFPVGAQDLQPGEKKHFLRYLAQHSLQIDVWDSNSLRLIGSAAVELKHLLRAGRPAVQLLLEELTIEHLLRAGRPAVQLLEELEVETLEFGRDSSAGCSAMTTITVETRVKGTLHLRLGNVGAPGEGSSPLEQLKASEGFGGGSLYGVEHMNVRNAGRALRMTELHGELVSLLGRGEKKGEWLAGRLGNETSPDEESPELAQERKLKRMAAVRDAEHQGGAIHHKTHMWRREERSDWLRSLRVIGAMRDERKRDDITSMLNRSITSRVTLYCPLAAARPLVVKLTNPYGTPHTFKIHTSNPDLSVVCDVREWGELRGRGDVQGVCVLEEGMFRLDDAAVPHVYLRPRETLHIPFKYQTFTTQSVAPVRSHQVVQELPSPSLGVKSIKVSFVGQDDRPVSIVEVRVELLPHVVDQTIRFTHPQNTQLKKAIRLPPTEATDLRVCCNDPDVQCEIISKSPGEPQDVQVKMDGCSSPNIKTFNIIVFTDRWRLVPAQIWQVSVHFLQWMDISCVTGQLTCQSLVLRGTQANRRVRCHVSHPLEIWVDPCEVFALPARAVCELRVCVRCVSSGVKFLQLNVVDEQQHQLVDAWSICVNAQPPAITRTWDVCVPVGGGRGSTKKFSYTNPYTHTHTFTLLTDQPHLLHFKQDSFQVGGGQTYSIGLRFAPSQSCGQQEILIFINNQDQRNQDTFRAQVTYS